MVSYEARDDTPLDFGGFPMFKQGIWMNHVFPLLSGVIKRSNAI
jgi:hypothetical protein